MKRIALLGAVGLVAALGACSQETGQNASELAERAANDAQANAEVVGEVIEDGAIEAAGDISDGAANIQNQLEAGDTREPGPAPITGDDLGS